MRWFWIDRFEEFVRTQRATAVKAVSLAEEHLHDHFPGAAIMPNSLVLEGMAQTAGILAADALDYRRQVVLVKVGSSDFHREAVPGDTLRYRAELVHFNDNGSLARVTSTIDGRPQAEAELYFGHVETGTAVPKLFRDDEMLTWLDNLRIYDVAVNPDGTPVTRRAVSDGRGPQP